jgi:DNA-binding NarL/FixJ family response regulator
MKKKVALVEDNAPLQRQLVELLNSQPDIECLLAVSTAEAAVESIPGVAPDVIIMASISLGCRGSTVCP